MTEIVPIEIVSHTVDAESYDLLIHERRQCLERTIQALRRLEEHILPTLETTARQSVEAHISAVCELNPAELRVRFTRVEALSDN
jgi:hypothetical protein